MFQIPLKSPNRKNEHVTVCILVVRGGFRHKKNFFAQKVGPKGLKTRKTGFFDFLDFWELFFNYISFHNQAGEAVPNWRTVTVRYGNMSER